MVHHLSPPTAEVIKFPCFQYLRIESGVISHAVNISVTSSRHIYTTVFRRPKLGEFPSAVDGVLPACVTDGSDPVQDLCRSAAVENVKENKGLRCSIKNDKIASLSLFLSLCWIFRSIPLLQLALLHGTIKIH